LIHTPSSEKTNALSLSDWMARQRINSEHNVGCSFTTRLLPILYQTTLSEEAQHARSAATLQARQEGELAALRQQLHDQPALIERLTQKA
jgi:hypothetical protein